MQKVAMMKTQPNREKTEHARSMILKRSSCPAGVGADRSISKLRKASPDAGLSSEYEKGSMYPDRRVELRSHGEFSS